MTELKIYILNCVIKNVRKQEFLCIIGSSTTYLVFYGKQTVFSGNKYLYDPWTKQSTVEYTSQRNYHKYL